jgi:hypothetical protein
LKFGGAKLPDSSKLRGGEALQLEAGEFASESNFVGDGFHVTE